MSFWPVGCFKDHSVLIVGGTSGIGAAVAGGFLEEGADVTVTGATEAEARAARTSMPGIAAKVVDVRDGDAVEALINELTRLHHLVNCAGVIRRGDELD